MNKKRTIIISIIGIILVFLILISITYGYYLTHIKGNTNNKSITLSIANLELLYDDGNGEIIANKIIPGKPIDVKTFSVKNTGTAKVENYVVYIEKVANTFIDKDDIKLSLKCTSTDGTNCNGNTMTYPSSDSLIVVNDIEVGTTHNYELEIIFNETNNDQSDNMNKTISGNVVIKDLKSTEMNETTIAGKDKIDISNASALSNYKIYGNSVYKSSVPSEYQQVEYIESTGTQYIEIDYIASNNTSSKGKYQIMDDTKSGFLFGSRKSFNENYYGFSWGGSTPWKLYNAYYSGVLTNTSIDKNIHTFYKNKGELYVDDVKLNTHTYAEEFNTPYKMIIFGCNTLGTINGLSNARIYNLQFYDNEELIIDLVPVSRKSDNTLGLYDTITGTFYTNKGSGNFKSGDLPTPNNPLEILSVGNYDESQNKYLLPINLSGKNLINIDDFEGEKTGNVEVATTLILEPNKTYTLSVNIETSLENFFVQVGSGDNYYRKEIKTIECNESGKQIITFVPTSEMLEEYNSLILRFIRPSSSNESTSYTYSVKDIQVEEGTIPTPYEPYVESTTINIFLNEPLRKIGDCDECSDYIDFQSGKVVRNISKIILNEKTNWNYYAATNINQFYKIYNNVLHDNSLITTMSTHFKGWSINNRNNNYNTIYTYSNGLAINDNRFTTTETFSDWLVNNNVIVLHRNIKPLEENSNLINVINDKGYKYLSVDTIVKPSNIEIDVIK